MTALTREIEVAILKIRFLRSFYKCIKSNLSQGSYLIILTTMNASLFLLSSDNTTALNNQFAVFFSADDNTIIKFSKHLNCGYAKSKWFHDFKC